MKDLRWLIAPNPFKNSLDPEGDACAIRDGLERSQLPCICECFPIGDGGDGTGELIIKKCGGSLVSGDVHDPLGRSLSTSFGLIDEGKKAVIEMGNASGLRLLKPTELGPLRCQCFGRG